MEENNNEEKRKIKMSVAEMSKKVFTAFIIILIFFFTVDFVKSAQNNDIPWIGRYMQEHYPELFSGSFQ